MGHVRMAGRVTEEERFGAKMGRIDVPRGDGFTTVYFTGGSIYRMTPTTEELARAVAERSQPTPVHQWELPKPVIMPPVVTHPDADPLIGYSGHDDEEGDEDDEFDEDEIEL